MYVLVIVEFYCWNNVFSRYLVEEIQHIDVRVYKIEKKQNNFIFDSIYDTLVL